MDSNYQSQIPPGMLLRVIQNKQDKIVYYERLHTMTADLQSIEIIKNILFDEEKHLNLFLNLYNNLFKERPDLPGGNLPQINSFIDGVKFSVINELNAYSFYVNVFLTDSNEEVRNTFLQVLFDENSHSAKFNYIYSVIIEKHLFQKP